MIPRKPRQVIVFTMPAGVSLRPGVPVLPVLLSYPADHCRHSQCRYSKSPRSGAHVTSFLWTTILLMNSHSNSGGSSVISVYRFALSRKLSVPFTVSRRRWISLSVEYRWRFPPHTGVLPLRRARDASRRERRLHGARLCQKVISGSVNSPNPIFYALHVKKYFRMRGIVF